MQQIIRHLFKADSLEDVPRQRLEELIEEHPSFSVGHYLLSKKLKAEQADHFSEETQRTNLYFTNPLWLHWLLEGRGEEKGWPPRSAEAEKLLAAEDRLAAENKLAAENEFHADNIAATEDIPAAGDGALIAMGEVAPFGDLPAEGLAAEAATIEEAPIMGEMGEYPAEEESSEETVTHAPVEEQHFQESLTQAPVAAEESAEAPAGQPDSVVLEQHMDEAQPMKEAQSETPVVEQVASASDVEQVASSPVAPVAAGEEPLVFQSYHTIDYFASQGIKLTLDENQNPSDRLGRQLKSFTEWLKVMKKMPKKEEDVKPDAIAEQKIQAIAAHSLEEREVLTETMAEVLAKQGMWQKAAEVYHKLSLLNPDKSAYFAGLIGQMQARSNEQLNTN